MQTGRYAATTHTAYRRHPTNQHNRARRRIEADTRKAPLRQNSTTVRRRHASRSDAAASAPSPPARVRRVKPQRAAAWQAAIRAHGACTGLCSSPCSGGAIARRCRHASSRGNDAFRLLHCILFVSLRPAHGPTRRDSVDTNPQLAQAGVGTHGGQQAGAKEAGGGSE